MTSTKRIWIVRRHPPMPYRSQPGHLAAFTIHSSHGSRTEASTEAEKRNKRASVYLYTVAKVELKEKS